MSHLVLLSACQPAEDAPDTKPTTDPSIVTDTPDETTDTGTPPETFAAPTALTASCDPTDNVLRYTCTVHVEPPQPAQINWVRDDGLGPVRIHTSDSTASDHTLDLYFLAGREDYTVTASATARPDGLTADVALLTGEVPSEVATYLTSTGASTMGLVGTETPCDQGAVRCIRDRAVPVGSRRSSVDPGRCNR